jgi:hypothetical protein
MALTTRIKICQGVPSISSTGPIVVKLTAIVTTPTPTPNYDYLTCPGLLSKFSQNYDVDTSTFTIVGVGSIAEYINILQNIEYISTGVITDTIQVTITDHVGISNVEFITVRSI